MAQQHKQKTVDKQKMVKLFIEANRMRLQQVSVEFLKDAAVLSQIRCCTLRYTAAILPPQMLKQLNVIIYIAAAGFRLYQDIAMKEGSPPNEGQFFVSRYLRYLNFHTLAYLIQLALAKPNPEESQELPFPSPTFEMFRPISRYYNHHNDRYKLFKNILLSYRWEISVGILLTVIYSSLNLLLSQIIKEFMETMRQSNSQRSSSEITEKFAVLQILRMIFGSHMRRVFQELAIQIESTIAKRLVKKALHLDPEYRKRIPQTEIYQLENVDLRIIYNLFTILYLGCEIPYTIGIAIIWLFGLNFSLGVISMYWFIVIFLVQRVLDDRMKHCNLTKLGLIDKRSKLNYEFLEKMVEARVVHTEKMLVDRNNDLFIEECHDHELFYRYSSLYDIAQLLLPIAVVVTAVLYNQSSRKQMAVEELYLILSMLGICYRPMKEVRKFTIAMSDGFHSLRRITYYLELPDERPDHRHYCKAAHEESGRVIVAKGTTGKVGNRGVQFQLNVTHHIELQPGERLVVLGRRGQGSTTFLSMLAGRNTLTSGNIRIQGRVAYLSEESFIIIDNLYKNLAFYDNEVSEDEADFVCRELGLYEELATSRGLQEDIEPNKYNENQLKMVSLARVLCSRAKVYILDNPFSGLTNSSQSKVEKILRDRQAKGVVIVTALKKIEAMQEEDWVVILNVAVTKEFGQFKTLSVDPHSFIDNFFKNSKLEDNLQDDEEKAFRRVAREFQNKIRKAMMYAVLFQKESELRKRRSKVQFLVKTVKNYNFSLLKQHEEKKSRKAEEKQEADVSAYFMKFLTSCKIQQSAYIRKKSLILVTIIIAVEVLHIFIHFYIGHEYEHRARAGIESMKSLVLYEVVLTLGLAGLIYLQGEVSSHLAVIAGNKLYRQSIDALVHKELRWYGQEYSLRTADKLNHDYQQIFILVHGVLTLYKNAVILIATALFVGGSHYIVLLVTGGVAGLYWAIWKVVRSANVKVLKRYYDYKYEYVKVFDESIDGSELINVYGVNKEVVAKAKSKYANLASYKLAINYVAHAQTLLCEMTATIITALALEFGTEFDVDSVHIASLATSILLLLNLAEVLKAILDAAVQVQFFFRINILPFMQISSVKGDNYVDKKGVVPAAFDLKFDSVLLKESDEKAFEIYPLKLTIPQGQIVCIYEEDETLRNNLLYGLTRNLTAVSGEKSIDRTIFIGDVPLSAISSQTMCQILGVVNHTNFYLSGPLEDTLKWRCPHYDEQLAVKLAKVLDLAEDLKRFNELGLKANIQSPDQDFSEGLSKKIAVLRLILQKVRIVIIKDTPPFVGRWSIIELMRKYNPGCTIIKLTNSLQVAYDVQRVILLQHLLVVEQGNPKKLLMDKLSKIGEMLRMCNEETYIYRNKISVNPRNFNKKEHGKKLSVMLKSKKKAG